MKNQKRFAGTTVLIIILLVVIAGSAYYIYTIKKTPLVTSLEVKSPEQTRPTQASPVAQVIKTTSGYADTITSTSISGVAKDGNSIDVYVYGPNNGNPRDVGMDASGSKDLSSHPGAGNLIFSQMNVPVIDGHWSVMTPAPLQGNDKNGWFYYQVNIGHPYDGTAKSLTMGATGISYDLVKVK